MRHQRAGRKLGRSKAHREQLLGSLVSNLILQSRIRTTVSKAKEAKRDADKMVTLARKGTLAARRLAAARLRRPEAVSRLFESVVPAMEGRKGGYTRVTKLGQRRSDGSEMAILEWVVIPAAPVVNAVTACSGQAVGASTCLPLADESADFLQPFPDPTGYFYLGESVLLPEYRGQRWGHLFFDEREARARELGGFHATCFCAVERPARPGHRSLEPFWKGRGYVHHPELRCMFSWKDVGSSQETEKPMSFWLRPL